MQTYEKATPLIQKILVNEYSRDVESKIESLADKQCLSTADFNAYRRLTTRNEEAKRGAAGSSSEDRKNQAVDVSHTLMM